MSEPPWKLSSRVHITYLKHWSGDCHHQYTHRTEVVSLHLITDWIYSGGLSEQEPLDVTDVTIINTLSYFRRQGVFWFDEKPTTLLWSIGSTRSTFQSICPSSSCLSQASWYQQIQYESQQQRFNTDPASHCCLQWLGKEQLLIMGSSKLPSRCIETNNGLLASLPLLLSPSQILGDDWPFVVYGAKTNANGVALS